LKGTAAVACRCAEILLEGRVSKAADVYAFGITMWEMYTGRRAFEGIPRALLGHQITKVCQQRVVNPHFRA
jgi:serine/threonine protein kinase